MPRRAETPSSRWDPPTDGSTRTASNAPPGAIAFPGAPRLRRALSRSPRGRAPAVRRHRAGSTRCDESPPHPPLDREPGRSARRRPAPRPGTLATFACHPTCPTTGRSSGRRAPSHRPTTGARAAVARRRTRQILRIVARRRGSDRPRPPPDVTPHPPAHHPPAPRHLRQRCVPGPAPPHLRRATRACPTSHPTLPTRPGAASPVRRRPRPPLRRSSPRAAPWPRSRGGPPPRGRPTRRSRRGRPRRPVV